MVRYLPIHTTYIPVKIITAPSTRGNVSGSFNKKELVPKIAIMEKLKNIGYATFKSIFFKIER